LAVFNSKLFYYFITKTSTPYNNNYFYFKTNYIEPFCIPEDLAKSNLVLNNLVEKVLLLKSDNKSTIDFENEIDIIVYRLYNLTWDEVKLVDPNFLLSEAEYNAIAI